MQGDRQNVFRCNHIKLRFMFSVLSFTMALNMVYASKSRWSTAVNGRDKSFSWILIVCVAVWLNLSSHFLLVHTKHSWFNGENVELGLCRRQLKGELKARGDEGSTLASWRWLHSISHACKSRCRVTRQLLPLLNKAPWSKSINKTKGTFMERFQCIEQRVVSFL